MTDTNIISYDPQKRSTETLKEDYISMCKQYSLLKDGKAGYSKETIINTAKLIFTELGKRGVNIKPESMKDGAKELYDIISKNVVTEESVSDMSLLSEDELREMLFT